MLGEDRIMDFLICFIQIKNLDFSSKKVMVLYESLKRFVFSKKKFENPKKARRR
jgi:hypothetical protein